MRKIDTEAYNKRLHTEIMELDKMIKSINPENVNQFDAGLIETADKYIKLISDTTWADNSNFNGIEMHKIKDMLNHCKINKRKYYVERKVFPIVDSQKETMETVWIKNIFDIPVREGFDGRKSIVLVNKIFCRVANIYHEGFNPKRLTRSDVPAYEEIGDRGGGKVMIYKNRSTITVDSATEVPINLINFPFYEKSFVGATYAFADIFIFCWK